MKLKMKKKFSLIFIRYENVYKMYSQQGLYLSSRYVLSQRLMFHYQIGLHILHTFSIIINFPPPPNLTYFHNSSKSRSMIIKKNRVYGTHKMIIFFFFSEKSVIFTLYIHRLGRLAGKKVRHFH